VALGLTVALAGLVLGVVLGGQLTREGYSVDEEFTLFAVRGIQAYGLPLLPSHLLYDRGILYSYAAWLGGLVAAPSLPTFRGIACAAALGALLALFSLVRTVANGRAAILAVALVSVSVPFVAVATTARFYAPFLLFYVLALRALARQASSTRLTVPGAWGVAAVHERALPTTVALVSLFVLALLARGTHELAFTLAGVPVAAFVFSSRRRRRAWAACTVALLAGLITAQLALVAVHQWAPAPARAAVSAATHDVSEPSMLTRFFVWQLVNLIEWPLDPLDFFVHILRLSPGLAFAVVLTLVLRIAGKGAPWSAPQRFAHILWIGWVLLFGVIDSGITTNYLLVPVVLMLTALAIDIAVLTPRAWFTPVALMLLLSVSVEQWAGGPQPLTDGGRSFVAEASARLDGARPTLTAPTGVSLPDLATRADLVACTDELACLLLAGRVDRWLALDDFLRTRFIVVRNGREQGVYAGSPVARTLPELFEVEAGQRPRDRVVVIDVFKDLPVGPSERFLVRALRDTPLPIRVILETSRLRVLEITRAAAGVPP